MASGQLPPRTTSPWLTTTIPNFLLGNVRQVFVMGNSSRLGIGWEFSWGKFLVSTTYTLQAICIMLPVYWAILWHVVYWALIEGCGHCSPLVVLVNLDGKVACQVLSGLLWCVVTGITLHSACSRQVLLKLYFCKSRGPLPSPQKIFTDYPTSGVAQPLWQTTIIFGGPQTDSRALDHAAKIGTCFGLSHLIKGNWISTSSMDPLGSTNWPSKDKHNRSIEGNHSHAAFQLSNQEFHTITH